MSPPVNRRNSSPVTVAVAFAALAAVIVLGIAGLNRMAYGEPVIPEQFTRVFDKSDEGLPSGMNYDLSVLDPQSQRTLAVLPQLGTVEVRLAITNDSALPVTLTFPTALQCEFTVRRIYTFLGGLMVVPLEVWRSSYFHNYARTPTTLALRPGETKVYSALWTVNGLNQLEVPPGQYRIFASVPGVKPLPLEKPL